MPTAILAEDEEILRTQLAGKLAKLWPDLQILASVGDGAAALEALEDRVPDFMFLDIQMPEMTGIEVARHVAGRCHVVFVTAYDQYAIQAFETGAVDYLLKPATDERLAVTIERLKAKLATAPPGPERGARAHHRTDRGKQGRSACSGSRPTVGQNLRPHPGLRGALLPVRRKVHARRHRRYRRRSSRRRSARSWTASIPTSSGRSTARRWST
jgi:CheY-like chemotaxis protein